MQNTCYHCFQSLESAGPCPHCGYDPAQDVGKYPLALKAGSILNGRYIVGRVLGQGGFGITYIAQDVQTGEKVAIKEYFPETMATRTGSHNVTAFSGQRQENFTYGMQCFLSEAQTLAQFIGMEHIVRVHSYFEENGTAYFVMDYIDGVSFQAYLKQKGGKIDWEEAKSILFPIMDALSTVHSKGIIHRDISPDNIYITSEGKVKLLDFGAARYSLGDRSRSLDVVLKAGYAPMEQYTRRGRQGPYTDVYAMAATFYFAITGKLPPESVERIEEDLLVLPSSYGARLPEAAEDALEKALAVRATERWQSMAEFRHALTTSTTFTPVIPVPDIPVPDPAPVPGPVPSPVPEPVPSKPNPTLDKKDEIKISLSKATLVKLGAAAAAVLFMVIMLFGGGGDDGKESKPYSGSSLSSAQTEKETEVEIVNRVRKVTSYNADNTIASTKYQEYRYDGKGNTSAIKITTDAAGEEPSVLEMLLSHDADGNTTRQDSYLDGELSYTFTYSDYRDGNYYSSQYISHSIDYVANYTYTYDSDGNMLLSSGHSDTSTFTSEYIYDADGNNTSYHYEFYYKGTLSSSSDTYYTYDAKGDCISSEYHSYDDGVLEKTEKTTYTYEYDSEDYLLRQTAYKDDGSYEITEYERVEVPLGVESGYAEEPPAPTEAPALPGTLDFPSQNRTISAAITHALVLTNNGTVLTSGSNTDGRSEVSGWKNIVSVSAGYAHTVGLKSDGTVIAVGSNDSGECNVGGWRNITAVYAGGGYEGGHTVGLKADGTVVATGTNEYGQCDVSGWTDIVSIALGDGYTIGLRSDGTVVAAGDNSQGECKVTGWRNIIAVSAGVYHTVGLKADGTVVVAGNNGFGQHDAAKWTDIVAIDAGHFFTLGIKSDGTVVAVGHDESGQCSTSGWRDIVAVAAGYTYALGLKSDGTMVSSGNSRTGAHLVSEWRNIRLP